jgi:hypothetical protein
MTSFAILSPTGLLWSQRPCWLWFVGCLMAALLIGEPFRSAGQSAIYPVETPSLRISSIYAPTLQVKQSDTADGLPQLRLSSVLYGAGASVGLMYGYLGFAWYAQSQRSAFHWFNDWQQWQQMDKLGHAYGAYHQSRLMMELLTTYRRPLGEVLWLGGLTGFALQLPIEVMDGFAADWGASWPDLVFNGMGSALAMGNYALWGQQRVLMQFSFWPSPYAAQHPRLLGSGTTQILKDYNGQTYWLALRWGTFMNPQPKGLTSLLRTVCPAVGMGASGMIGGYGQVPTDIIRARESRQYYVGFSIDWEQIPTRKRWVRCLLVGMNCIRPPLPALSFDERTGWGVVVR